MIRIVSTIDDLYKPIVCNLSFSHFVYLLIFQMQEMGTALSKGGLTWPELRLFVQEQLAWCKSF